ncbi:hypothetical protein [Kitasatospora sp. NPDC057936]|uniref:hypothetical protein n=1 Tax=Kitasatospora sp. NPDC057936 TaxID=3346283 RepID=UPI0036DD62F4
MNNYAAPLDAWQGISWKADTRPSANRHVLPVLHAVPLGDRWLVQVDAIALASLAAMPDAAIALRSRRGYLPESPGNQALAEMLRRRPQDFGLVGGPIVLGAESLQWEADRVRGGGRLWVSGLECYDGFQRLVIMAHVARELPPPELVKAVLWVVVVTGEDRRRTRDLCDTADRCVSPAVPQDNLGSCPHLRAVREEFAAEGSYFDTRRGVVSGPHPVGFTIADVFRSLAALSRGSSPRLSNRLQTDEGLDALWSDLGSDAYRSIVHEDVHAISVQRAVEARREAQKALARLRKRHSTGHYKLLEYAPELVIWGACRMLPRATLHDGGRNSPRWTEIIHGQLPAETERVAHLLVASYERRRGAKHMFKNVAPRLDLWLELVDDVFGCG